jgi:hypothetical protein
MALLPPFRSGRPDSNVGTILGYGICLNQRVWFRNACVQSYLRLVLLKMTIPHNYLLLR